MRIFGLSVALLAVFECVCVGVYADDSLLNVAAKKAVEEAAGTPVTEFMKDFYDAVVRKKGTKFYKNLRYKLAGLGKEEPLQLAVFLMNKLKEDVFDGQVNEKVFKALTQELYYALKDFYNSTPEDPSEAADLGAWHALVSLYKDVLGPALRGSDRLGAISNMLLDPELETLKKYVSEFKGVPLQKKAAVRSSVSSPTVDAEESPSTTDGEEKENTQ